MNETVNYHPHAPATPKTSPTAVKHHPYSPQHLNITHIPNGIQTSPTTVKTSPTCPTASKHHPQAPQHLNIIYCTCPTAQRHHCPHCSKVDRRLPIPLQGIPGPQLPYSAVQGCVQGSTLPYIALQVPNCLTAHYRAPIASQRITGPQLPYSALQSPNCLTAHYRAPIASHCITETRFPHSALQGPIADCVLDIHCGSLLCSQQALADCVLVTLIAVVYCVVSKLWLIVCW